MRGRSLAILAVLGVLAGCNGSTDPQTGVNGTWTYTANNLAGNESSNTSDTTGFVCSLSMNVSLTQSGSTFTGNLSGTGQPNSSVICTRGSEQIGPYIQRGPITDGMVSGDTVTFGAFRILGGWTFTGTFSGNSMSGELSLKVPLCDCDFPPAPVTSDTMLVTGHWSAKRS
jgi:hypothetical protein